MLIVDGHEDLAYNALVDGRDYLRSAYETRADEDGGPIPVGNGLCMLGLPEWLRGGIGVIITTITAIPREDCKAGELGYSNPEGAYQQGIAQLNVYGSWAADHPQICLVKARTDLDRVLESWARPDPERRQVGMVLLIENADLIRRPEEVCFWYEHGVRLIGPAWNSNRYTANTEQTGTLTDLGRSLLKEMESRGMILDLSHMSDAACAEAVATYQGPIVATHANPRRLVDVHRLIPDETIRGVIEHDGVVGIMPANWALHRDAWSRRITKPDIHLDLVVDAIDVVCQLAGDARHAGIGTDFDGGFGAEQAPAEIDTIADLPRVADALAERGYDEESILAIMSGNWLRVLRGALDGRS
jgi:membrane dipeptidase